MRKLDEKLYPITWYREDVAGVPALITRPDVEGKFPAVIYYHGWGNFPEKQLSRLQFLAMHGMVVICPSAKYHGWRNPAPGHKLVDHEDMDDSAEYMWKAIEANLEEAPAIYEAVKAMDEVDEKGIFLYGNSMGAMTASKVFKENKELLGCALTNGTWMWEKISAYLSGKFLNRVVTPPKGEATLEDFRGRNLFVSGGDLDDLVPQEPVIRAVEQLKAEGSPAEYVLYEGLGHYVTVYMLEEVLNFYYNAYKEVK